MLYICIPTFDESPTIGVLLWRIRKVFQAYSREYEILVYDDASTDNTLDTLTPYAEVTPLTVIRGKSRQGYGHAIDALAREVSRRTRYPRRDGMIIMQADFTDQPEDLPELVKRFEGGADIVIAERVPSNEPIPVRRLRRLAPWALRFFVPISGVDDPFGSLRLYRISLIRELIKASEAKPLITAGGWGANVELLMQTMPRARRVERVAISARYDIRTRRSRIRPFADAMAMYRFGRGARGQRIAMPVLAVATPAPPTASPRERVRS